MLELLHLALLLGFGCFIYQQLERRYQQAFSTLSKIQSDAYSRLAQVERDCYNTNVQLTITLWDRFMRAVDHVLSQQCPHPDEDWGDQHQPVVELPPDPGENGPAGPPGPSLYDPDPDDITQ